MMQFVKKAGTSLKHLFKSIPLVAQQETFSPMVQPKIRGEESSGYKKMPHLGAFSGLALAGTLLALGAGATIIAKEGLQKNSLEGRVQVTQFPANNPCEDTYNVKQFTINGKKHGYYAAVFDGHGGWQLAEYAKKNLHVYLEEELKKRIGKDSDASDKDYIKAIEAAFDKVETEFLEFSKEAYKKGYPNAAYVGACALVAVVSGNKLYVASAGDCLAGLIRDTDKGYECIKVSKRFSANKKSEQERLRKAFSLEPDIVKCKSKTACYVKGNLMPTRSFGDFRLKYAEFNKHEFSGSRGYRIPLATYTGPYITHKPDIRVHTIEPKDRFLILASDGLWDEMKTTEVATIVEKSKDNPEKLSDALFQEVIAKVEVKTGIEKDDIIAGRFQYPRRSIHDDITIVVVDINSQT